MYQQGITPSACPIETLRIDHIPDGFRERRLGDTMWTTKFECAQCGMMTHYKHIALSRMNVTASVRGKRWGQP